jgi:hypothetical protein
VQRDGRVVFRPTHHRRPQGYAGECNPSLAATLPGAGRERKRTTGEGGHGVGEKRIKGIDHFSIISGITGNFYVFWFTGKQ